MFGAGIVQTFLVNPLLQRRCNVAEHKGLPTASESSFPCAAWERDQPSSLAPENSIADRLLAEAWRQATAVTDYVRSAVPVETAKSALWTAFDKALEAAKNAEKGDKAKSDWTVMLNLTTDFDQDPDGTFYRLEDLREYATQTKGTGLTIVVQAAFLQEEGKKGNPDIHSLERYVVRNGEITRVQNALSKGYGQDLEDLVAFTAKNYPSKNMALIMDSHGMGNEGMFGDTGKISLDDFVKHIQTGLKGNERQKLDLVHFDSCYMAQSGVMGKVARVADYMVASSEAEAAAGISLLPVLDTLKDTPKSDARALGRALVREARVQTPGFIEWGWDIPIHTISSVNLRQYASFKKALDTLGEKLADSLKDPKNMEVLESCIDASRKFGKAGSVESLAMNVKPDKYRVDLKDFANQVVQAIEDGRLPDEDRSIKRCAQALLEERAKLVDASFGYDKDAGHGGVSVFLPGRDLRNVEEEARRRNPAGRMHDWSRRENFEKVNASDETRKTFIKNMEVELALIRPVCFLGVRGVDNERKAVEEALAAFAKATKPEDRARAFATINATSSLLEQTAPFQQQRKEAAIELRKNASKLFTAQLDDGGKTGWSRFRAAVSRREVAAK